MVGFEVPCDFNEQPDTTDKTLAQLGVNDLGCKWWATASTNDKSSDLVCNHHNIPP